MNASLPPRVLSIAGSDSGGGAGIQADLKAFARCGVHGMTAITAITAQNTVAVEAVYPLPPEAIVAQVRAVAEDIGIDAVKIGMLGTTETIEAVDRALDLVGEAPIVLDPVMVAESGARLLDRDAEAALRTRLLPRVTVVTPNVPEARALAEGAEAGERDGVRAGGEDGADELARDVAGGERAGDVAGGERAGDVAGGERAGDVAGGERAGDVAGGERAGDVAGAERAGDVAGGERARVVAGGEHDADGREAESLARAIHALGPRAVVVTGGHRERAADLFFDGERLVELPGERYPSGASHGSGCTHSSALAAHLALGLDPLDAAREAKRIASEAVRDGLRGLGGGAGPVDVFGLARGQSA